MVQDFINNMKITEGIAVSDVLGWMLAAIGSYIVYKMIDHVQTSMERHERLSEVEKYFSEIYNSIIARTGKGKLKKVEKFQSVMVRSVLHDNTDWYVAYDVDKKMINKRMLIEHQLYIQIRKGKNAERDEWIATQALHEIMLHCRRIEKMYKDGIIKRIDLADLSREILPLGISGRMEFFSAYYDKYAADSVGYLVMQTIVSCEKYHNNGMVKKFVDYYNAHPDIHQYFVKSYRIRKIKDYFAVRKFENICLRYKESSNNI